MDEPRTSDGPSRPEAVTSDAELVRGILTGSATAAATLFRRHAETLFSFVMPRVGGDCAWAEDVTQDTFVDAWRHLDRFDPARCFPAWLVGIARRKLARSYRRRGRIRDIDPTRILACLDAGPADPSARLEAAEATLAVTAALATLPASAAELLRGKYVEGKSLRELARNLRIRPEAVSSRLQRARSAFRRVFEESGGFDVLQR